MNAAPDNDGSKATEREGAIRSVGERLQQAREQHKLLIEEVAEKLHIDMEIVEALERDDDANLPAPIFVQGYLKNYARLVGLPPELLIKEYIAQGRNEPPPLSSVTTVSQKLPGARFPTFRLFRNILLLALAGLLVWMAYPYAESIIRQRATVPDEVEPGRLELPLSPRSERIRPYYEYTSRSGFTGIWRLSYRLAMNVNPAGSNQANLAAKFVQKERLASPSDSPSRA